MSIVIKILSCLVALEFFFIFYLETLATSSKQTASVFGMSDEELSNKNVQVLFKNQGVYNALLAVLIVLATFVYTSQTALICLMGYIVVVAAYGAITSNPKILFMQGGLPIITLIATLVL